MKKTFFFILLLPLLLWSCFNNDDINTWEDTNTGEFSTGASKISMKEIEDRQKEDYEKFLKEVLIYDYSVEEWKLYATNGDEKLDLLENYKNVWLKETTCSGNTSIVTTGTGAEKENVYTELINIIDDTEKKLSFSLRTWICWTEVEGKTIYILDKISNTFQELMLFSLFLEPDEKYWESPIVQYVWLEWSILKLNVYKVLDEQIWVKNSWILSDISSTKEEAEEKYNLEYIETVDLDLESL